MYANVLKSSEAAKKAWASRKRTSKEFWSKGPDGKGAPASPSKAQGKKPSASPSKLQGKKPSEAEGLADDIFGLDTVMRKDGTFVAAVNTDMLSKVTTELRRLASMDAKAKNSKSNAEALADDLFGRDTMMRKDGSFVAVVDTDTLSKVTTELRRLASLDSAPKPKSKAKKAEFAGSLQAALGMR